MARYERHPWDQRSAERTRAAVGRWAQRNAPRRPPPKSTKAQARWLRDELYGGSTRRMAEHYGVSQRTVERWIKGTRGKGSPLRDRLAGDVSQARETRAARRAARRARAGQPMRVRAKGWVGPVGASPRGRAKGTPTTRLREMPPMDLDPDGTAAMLAAYERDDPDAMRDVLAGTYGDYFSGGASGRWVTGADVGEIERIDFE